MTKIVKKTDQNKAWNRRTDRAKVYALESRSANVKRFLIICEGENTEPCYFRSFPVATAEVEAFGTGRSKTSLVEQAIEWISQESPDPEREVWIVFDMDFDHGKDESMQRNDFNQAIRLAEAKGFRVAYSNDAFELWFLLHYQLLESALTRVEYYQQISRHWGISYERHGKGIQFCRKIYQRLQEDTNSNQTSAIRHAERLHKQHASSQPADQNPCTTVYQLIIELNKYLKK
jgi:hypothetical protein